MRYKIFNKIPIKKTLFNNTLIISAISRPTLYIEKSDRGKMARASDECTIIIVKLQIE